MKEDKEDKGLKEMRKIIREESRKYLEELTKREEEEEERKGNPSSIFFIANFLDRRIESMEKVLDRRIELAEKTYLEPIKNDLAVLQEIKWPIRIIAGTILSALVLYILRLFRLF